MKMLMLCLFSVLLGACFGASSHFACDDQAIFQSTTGQWGDIVGHARLAVDGNKDTNWWAGSCTHTLPEDQDPFLTLDLGCSKKLAQVVLTNRMDCCTNRLRDFEIVLTQLPYSTACRNQVEVCAYHSGTFENTKAINCVGEGRFVTIRYKSPADIPDSDRRLHICEMEVKLAPEPKTDDETDDLICPSCERVYGPPSGPEDDAPSTAVCPEGMHAIQCACDNEQNCDGGLIAADKLSCTVYNSWKKDGVRAVLDCALTVVSEFTPDYAQDPEINCADGYKVVSCMYHTAWKQNYPDVTVEKTETGCKVTKCGKCRVNALCLLDL